MLDQPGDSEHVEIRPGVGLYSLFPSLRYTPWVALGEMVDNSIQSYLEHREELVALNGPDYRLRIDINFGGGENPTIQIVDNAAGIFTKDISRAFTPAMPPLDKSKISQYGIGMKSSACWYSNYFTVRTRALGEPFVRTIIFDIKKIIKDEIYSLEIVKEPTSNPKAHGTRIILSQLNQPIPTSGAASRLRSYLRSMYRDFLKTGELILTINGETQEAISYNWLKAPYWINDKGPVDETEFEWYKDLEVELTDSFKPEDSDAKSAPKIRGRIGILEKGDTKRAGLALLWRRKVVQGAGNLADSPDDLYRPTMLFGSANSFERQRIIGELDVSELKVTSFKDSVVWKEGQEEEALRKIKQILNSDPYPILKMARNFRALDNSKTSKARVDATLEELVETTTKAIIEGGIDSLGEDFETTVLEELPEPPRNTETKVVRRIIKLIPQFKSDIVLEVKDQGDDSSWLRVSAREEDKWVVTVNREHPFMNSFTVANPDSLEPILRIALALGIAEIQGVNSGFESAQFLRLQMNEILRNFLSSRSDVDVYYPEEYT
jgi:hypothetical protein